MTAPSAKPSPDSESSTLLLQRRLSRGDSHKWRTMLRLQPAQMALADEMISMARRIDPRVTWRLTAGHGELLAVDEP